MIYNEKPYSLITETLSEGGVYVKNNDLFPLGADGRSNAAFFGWRVVSVCREPLCIQKTLWQKMTDGLSGMGIQFRGQSDDAAKVLKEYIETIIAEGTRMV